ncbi:MAG: Smr/MutS family protein, partial [Gemmatimonadales bacterium]
FLLEARRKVEEALARARAAVDEATARAARRLVEQAIEETTGEEVGERGLGRGEGWMSLEDLKRARRAPSPTARPPERPAAPAPAVHAASEVSLRGLRVDEAEVHLVKALDDAVLADLPYLRVIHGKGTGAVRRRVHEILSADPRVRRFGFAPANQGGRGVTVVEFQA